jgi:predicted HAD superfamily phosphohydrolase YqeG
MPQYFYELDIRSFQEKTIIVDVDGTIAYDSVNDIASEVQAAMERLKERNTIFLSSNNRLPERVRELAERLGVRALVGPYKKPDLRVLASIGDVPKASLLVIGDKWLTDGRLAKRAGSQFIKVYIRGTYFLDDLVYGVVRFLGYD